MVDWALAQGSNSFQNAFAQGAAIGGRIRERRDERRFSNALSGLVANPQADDQQFQEIIAGLPGRQAYELTQMRNQYRQQVGQAERQAQTDRRADLPMLTRLLQSSTDEASYQRARGVAQQYGVDLSSAPANYDQAWVGQQLSTLQMLQSPQGQEAITEGGKYAVEQGLEPGSEEYRRYVTNFLNEKLAQPYTGPGGETRVRVPTLGSTPPSSGPQPGAIEDGYRFRGGDPSNPESWERVMTNEEGGSALQAAYQAGTITQAEANRVRQSLGPGGQAKFERWLRDNNIQVGAR